jgi:hypothetical protein
MNLTHHAWSVKNIYSNAELKPGINVFGYIFKNNGNNRVLISQTRQPKATPYILEPGEIFDTRNNGSLDAGGYMLKFDDYETNCDAKGVSELQVLICQLVNTDIQ